MVSAPAPWQLTLARIEGALPFISPELSECLALASLRRLWRVHVRDYPFDNLGIEHNPGLEADELMRSWYSEERRQFLSWISRRGVNGQRTLHPTPHANSPDRQNSLHRRYFLTPFNIRAAALDDGASLRP